MIFTSKSYLPVLASTLLLCINAPTFADGNHNGGSHYGYGQSTSVINLSTALTAGANAPTGFTGAGKFIFTYDSNTGNGALHASVVLPIDGSTIKDSNGAASSTYTLKSNGTSCTLAIRDIDFVYNSSPVTTTTQTSITENAEYGFSVSVTGASTATPVLTSSIGSCATVSAPKVGDTVTLTVPIASPVAGGPTTVTLTGTLAALSGH